MIPNSKGNRLVSVMTVLVLIFAIFFCLIQFADEAEGAIITVPVDYATIQEAIDAANPGDTILVWDGTYGENVVVNKTVSLVGNSSATTIIDANQAWTGVYIISDMVNITGFSVINASENGVSADSCSNIRIDDCYIYSNSGAGIYFWDVFNGSVQNSVLTSNSGEGIVLQEWGTDYTTIENCNIYNNSGSGIFAFMGGSHTSIVNTNISGHASGYGVYTWNNNDFLIKDCNIWGNSFGIMTDSSNDFVVDGTDIYSNSQYGIHMRGYNSRIVDTKITSNINYGLYMEYSSNNEIENTVISNHITGMILQGVPELKMTNSSIANSTTDLSLLFNSHANLLNTTFNKTRVSFGDLISTLTVRWFLHVYVNDSIGNPVSGANVIVRNATGIGIFDGLTDAAGYVNWITVTEYYENKSQRWLHTAHNITSYDGTDFGWAAPEPDMNMSKLVTVTLSSPMPTIDYIVIEDAIGGNPIGSVVYRIEDIVLFYSISYNNSVGFIGPVPATWSSNDTGVGDVVIGPTSKTSFTAITEGSCFVTAIYSIAIDSTGVLTTIWLVENLDQTTFHPTIQKAIDRANPGDTLLAKPWTYYEKVTVNKTVTLMGTNKSNTIVHGSWIYDAFQVSANWVNISGFSAIKGSSGIAMYNVLNTRIEDCFMYLNKWVGINVGNSDYTTINNTEIHSNYGGIYLSDFDTDYTTISNSYIHDNIGEGIEIEMNARNTVITDCNITGNGGNGIYMWNADKTTIKNNNIINNNIGITMEVSLNTIIENSDIRSNSLVGISVLIWGNNHRVINTTITSNNQDGIFLQAASNFAVLNTSITNHTYGIRAQGNSECKVTNSSIVNTNPANDLYIEGNSKITALNTSFNKNSVNITTGAELFVKWFMHVLVTDIVGNPISGAEVLMQNSTGALVLNGFTDVDGSVRWVAVTEYYENQTQRIYHTPHVVRATIGADIVSKNETMDASKFVMLQLASLQPAVALQLVAGLQYSNVNVDYDILASVTQDDGPRMHTVDTVILITVYDDDMNKVVDDDAMSLLDSDLGLYSYSNITSGVGVYFVVAHFTASGVSGIGLTSFEVVDWITDISNVNDSLGQIRDVLDYINLTTNEVNRTLDGFVDGFGDFWNQFNGTDLSNLTSLLDWFNLTMDMIRGFESNITTLLSDQNLDMARIDNNITAIDRFMQQAFSNLYENHTTTRDIISAYWDDWNNTIAQVQGNIGFLNTTLAQLATDLAILNASLNDLQQDIDYLNSTVPAKIDDLNTQLADVNASLTSQLWVMETNIMNNLASLNDTNILGFLQGMNDSLFTEIQGLLSSITNDIINLDSSLSDQLTNLLNNMTTNDDALRNWLDIVLTQIEANLTDAENLLADKIDAMNASMTVFNSNLQGDLTGIMSEIQLHDTVAGDNHTEIISKLDNLLSGGMGEVDLSELKGMLIDLAFNLSSANESLANELLDIVDDISTFQNQMSQDLDDINSLLADLDQLQDILTKLNDLDTNLASGNQQLEDKIDEIPKDKKEEDGAMGTTELLLIVVLVLLIVNILISLMKGGVKGTTSESIPHEEKEIGSGKPTPEASDEVPDEDEEQMEFGEEKDDFEDVELEESK